MRCISDGRNNRWIPLLQPDMSQVLREYFPKLIEVACLNHGYTYQTVVVDKGKENTERDSDVPLDNAMFKDNEFFKDLFHSPIGREALLYAIKRGLALVLPLNPPEVTVEFLSTHLIRPCESIADDLWTSNDSNDKFHDEDFVSANGIFGRMESNGLSPYVPQLVPLPSEIQTCPRRPSGLTRLEGGSSYIERGVFKTPIGNLPVIFISQPFRYSGCHWGSLTENVRKGWIVPRFKPLEINDINTEASIVYSTSSSLRSSEVVHCSLETNEMDIKKRKETEEREKKRLQVLFKCPTLFWLHAGEYEEESEIERQLADAMSTEPVAIYIAATRAQFPDLVRGKPLKERMRLLSRVVDGARKKLPETISTDDTGRVTIKGVLENVFSSLLYDYIWPPRYDRDARSQEVKDDQKLDRIIQQHQFLRAAHLDVNFLDNPEGELGLMQVIAILRKMNDVKCPSQKLVQLANAFKVLQSLTFSLLPPGDSVTADVLLPSFIYIIIRSQMTDLASTLSYISSYAERGDVNGEYSYYITNMFGAVSFLLSVDSSKLTIDKELYEDAVDKGGKEMVSSTYLFDRKRSNGRVVFERLKSASLLNKIDQIELLHSYQALLRENQMLKEELNQVEQQLPK